MNIKDVRVGMKVRLLSKHGLGDDFDNIGDFYAKKNGLFVYNNLAVDSIKDIENQGYGVVVGIESEEIVISSSEDGDVQWYFKDYDIEPYIEKTPKEWLLTPLAVCTARNHVKSVVINNGASVALDSGIKWCSKLESMYDEQLFYYDNNCCVFDIMKIEYNGKVVWMRNEYMTFDEARKTGKRIKHRDWNTFYSLTGALERILAYKNINYFLDSKVWEVER